MKNYELAYKDYEAGMKYKDIAEKYDVSINTVKSWKSRKWGAPPEEKVAHKKQKVCTQKELQPVVENNGLEDISDILECYGITEQQRRFADNYIETANIYKSAIKAGYSHNYANARGYELLGNVGIKKYVDDRLRVLSYGKVATQQEILQGLTRIFNREEREHQVVTLRSKSERWVPTGDDGQLKKMTTETEEAEVIDYPAKVSDVIKAGESLLKRLDLLGTNSGDGNITIVDAWGKDDEN